MRPRILVADDHSIVAEGLRSLPEKSYDGWNGSQQPGVAG